MKKPPPAPGVLMTSKEPIAIFIHGTFASSAESHGTPPKVRYANQGPRWWQQGSEFCQNLKARIQGHPVQLPETTKEYADVPFFEPGSNVFHWSGENSERARFAASKALLDKLVELEKQGQPYHLVGHSHGGSVIWGALQESVFRRWRSKKDAEALALNHMRSWTTVGTPFFQFKESWLGSWLGRIPNVTIATFLLAIVMLFLLGAVYQKQEEVAEVVAEAEELIDEAAPAIDPKEAKKEEIRQNLLQAIQAIPERIPFVKSLLEKNKTAVLISTVPIFLILLLVQGLVHVSRVEALEIKRQNRSKREAMRQYGRRWLGLWSRQDEAINGLKMSIKVSNEDRHPLVSPLDIPATNVFRSDIFARLTSRFVLLLIRPIYNRGIRPHLDGSIWGLLGRKAVGLDRPGCSVIRVTHTPTGALEDSYEGYKVKFLKKASAKSLPHKGKSTVILVDAKSGMHLRIFDREGELVADVPEEAFKADPEALEHLRQARHSSSAKKLTPEETAEICRSAFRLSSVNPLDVCVQEEIDMELIESANQHLKLMSGDLLTRTRGALANYSQGVEAFAKVVDTGDGMLGPELVHNSYFDHEGVVQLIGHHMVSQDVAAGLTTGSSLQLSPAAEGWTSDQQTLVEAEVASIETHHPKRMEPALSRLGQPNRWASVCFWLWILPVVIGMLFAAGIVLTSTTESIRRDFPSFVGFTLLVWIILLVLPGWIITYPLSLIARRRAQRGARKGWISGLMLESTTLWMVSWLFFFFIAIIAGALDNQ